MTKTEEQFRKVWDTCRQLFEKKLKDYGPAWRIMRPTSLTDQIYIKANRIRSIETKGVALVDEDVPSCYMAIVNYGIIALIQLEKGYSEKEDMTTEEALDAYDRHMGETMRLMLAKNHDYGEAWREMRTSSFTDLILMKINRTKQIENNGGQTIVSEGVDANYQDMVNYAVFGIIKLEDER